MIVPTLSRENAWTALKAWADAIVREDGDRDEDAGSNLTVEQTIAAARAMLAALPHLDGAAENDALRLHRDKMKYYNAVIEAEALLTMAVVPNGHDRCEMALKVLRGEIYRNAT